METIEKSKTKAVERKEDARPPEFEGTDEILIQAKFRDQLPVILRPCFDSTGRVYTGQGPTGHYETLSEEDKRSMNYVITPETTVVLTHDKVISWLNPIDRANWKWVRRHPYLALTKEKADSSRDAVFFVHNPVAEASRRVVASKVRDKARYIIQYEANRDVLVRACKVLGHLGADTLLDSQLQDYLLQQADAPGMAQMVLDAVSREESELVKAKILLSELQKYRLVQRGDAGLFRFGGEKGAPLGHTEDMILSFMMDEKNHDTVLVMKNALAERKHIPVE